MEKKTVSVHAFTIHTYTIAIVLLLIALLALGVKYVHLKLAVNDYTQSTMMLNEIQMHQPVSNITDYAAIIAMTAAQYPTSAALSTQPEVLQNYVVNLSKNLKRDVVIVDVNKKILADTVASNRGTNYSFDKENEVGLTIKDGISRSFVETSPDYPNGISEVVVAMKNANNEVVGAVIVSNFQVLQ